ncbi:probable RNA-directed DNA polymerase from transposon X-element [Trichonephila clavipes]|nr:probable RNA-directed DNA polymerase from transposon X-element [Trichonephila clavipes]
MTTEIDFPSLPSAPSANMETDPPLTDSEVCAKMRELRQDILLQSGSIQYLEFNLKLAVAGEAIQPKEQITKLVENVKEMKDLLEHKKGELASFSVCPIPSCQYHATINSPERIKTLVECTKSLENKPFPTSLPSASSDNNNSVDKNNVKNKANNKPNDNLNKNKKTRTDGFVSPTKQVKKQKVLQNYSVGALAPVNTSNKFQPIAGSSAMPEKETVAMLYPKTKTKLSGEFLKIFAASSDDHRDITKPLVEKKEQYFALNPTLNRPQKVVLKGLPINTDIDDIKSDLTSRGFQVEKVAQFTKTRTKLKLPIFMVELQRTPDSPDIFQLDTCCYLSIKVDTYNRRPGVAQCYNCNLFNHSSVNCHIQTRCLKCGESHKTGDCPIKEKLENPTCINCNQKGHMANSHRCPKYPKVQPKKGEASQNRNKNIARNKIQNPATVKENLSFANVLKGDHQMALLLDAPSPANSEPEAAAAPREKSQPPKSSNANQTSQSKDDKAFGFMDAILELKKFFSDYPSLLDCFGLRITSWNANGVNLRIVELRDFIDKHSPDIVLIQETHLGLGDTLHIPNFTTYRTDRPTPPNQKRRGGTAILLKSSLPHYHTPTPPTGTVEATSVTLTPPGSQPIVITSLYISPKFSYHPIHSDLETIFSLGDVSIVCGDFNAHHTSWGCKRNNQRGNIIKNLIDTTNTQLIAPNSHTRFGYNSASIIDFALTRNLPWPSQVESIAELSSDHNPIMSANTRFAFPKRNVGKWRSSCPKTRDVPPHQN